MYWKRLIVNSLAIYLLVARLLISSLLKQVVIELNYAVAKGEAFDRWSTSVATRQSSCKHDSALTAPSVTLGLLRLLRS